MPSSSSRKITFLVISHFESIFPWIRTASLIPFSPNPSSHQISTPHTLPPFPNQQQNLPPPHNIPSHFLAILTSTSLLMVCFPPLVISIDIGHHESVCDCLPGIITPKEPPHINTSPSQRDNTSHCYHRPTTISSCYHD